MLVCIAFPRLVSVCSEPLGPVVERFIVYTVSLVCSEPLGPVVERFIVYTVSLVCSEPLGPVVERLVCVPVRRVSLWDQLLSV